MKYLILLFLSFNIFSSTGVKQKPIKFKNSKAIFPNVLKADYKITYDAKSKKASVHTKMIFKTEEAGYPIFDLVPQETFLEVDGKTAKFESKKIEDVTTVKVIDKLIKAGEHTLEIKNTFSKLLTFEGSKVHSAFWMSDLSDRRYLEQFMPASFEYDQVRKRFFVKIINSDIEHILYTNGDVQRIAKNEFKVVYPSYYTSSSIFYHLVSEKSFSEIQFDYKSIDGRTIPVTIYKKSSMVSLSSFKSNTLKHLKVLEKDFGPFPHDSLLIYGISPFQGGMEYAGATWTSLSALRHELDHSYFARNIMPGRGNAGWIDEAIASWGDDNYKQYSTPSKTGVASHSIYRRTTDRNAYGPGSVLLGVLDKKFDSKGGLKPFLKDYFERNQESIISTKFFQTEMEDYFNTDLSDFFNEYIYSKRSSSSWPGERIEENPFHKKHSHRELLEFL